MSYTINQIQDEMTAAGSHWFDRDTLRFFSCRVSEKVYQGSGGIYFVTSEKCGDQPRAYSVRKYSPETKQIDTVGDFNSLTRAQAHREAVTAAGPDAIAAEQAHKPVSAAKQLSIDIKRGNGKCTIEQARRLIRLATRHSRMMVDHCNGYGEVYDADGEPSPKLAKLVSHIEFAAKRCGCGVVLGGDPRGCTCKLILPNKDTNDFGKEGWCVPVR
jgi:hypothetical protein